MIPGRLVISVFAVLLSVLSMDVYGQIGKRFPSERKVISDPKTGTELIFLTSTSAGDHKIYPTHNQWTSDGEWLIFRSSRVKGEAMAVHEQSGVLVQVTEGGYRGMLTIARNSMQLFFMRKPLNEQEEEGGMEVVVVDLQQLFSDSESGNLKGSSVYQKVIGVIPPLWGAHGDMALDANEDRIYFRMGQEAAQKYLPDGTELKEDFGPRGMGAGPGGIAQMDISSGEIKPVIAIGFQVGHIQTNPWVPGQIIFCWETGGKSPQRTWIVNADGSDLRPLYPEADYEWVTHEAVIGPEEVAMAILGHRNIPGMPENDGPEPSSPEPSRLGQEKEWGKCGTREKPTGLAIVNINTREMIIAGQIPEGSGFWHVHGSPDGRFAVGDDFSRSLYLIDRMTGEMMLLSTGHKRTAADHPHPTFSPDGTKIQIQSAMLSDDDRSMNICVIPVPEAWLNR